MLPRHEPRAPIRLPVDLFSAGFDGPLRARTRDLGLGGLCVETPSVFAPRSIRRVALGLPGEHLEMDARGCWQRLCPSGLGVLTGIAFERPPRQQAVRLWDLVLSEGSLQARRLYGSGDFEEFGIEELLGLCHASRLRRLPAGQRIYAQGVAEGDAGSIFAILEGAVSLRVSAASGAPALFERLGEGRLFGGLPLLATVATPETAVVEQDVVLLEVTASSFEMLRSSRPWLAERLARTVTRVYARRAVELIAQGAAAGPGGR
jgi:hypothetical protein